MEHLTAFHCKGRLIALQTLDSAMKAIQGQTHKLICVSNTERKKFWPELSNVPNKIECLPRVGFSSQICCLRVLLTLVTFFFETSKPQANIYYALVGLECQA